MQKTLVLAIMLMVAAGILFAPQVALTQTGTQDQRFPNPVQQTWMNQDWMIQVTPWGFDQMGIAVGQDVSCWPLWGLEISRGVKRPVLIPRPTTFTRYSESAWPDPNVPPWYVVP